jgi:5,10-methylenetetrahydromethanopterin reductase
VTASAARAVAEAAPGRFILGIGAGDSALGFDGLRHSTLAEMTEGLARLRQLMAGDGVAFGDFEARLRGASTPAPVYVAGSGPRTLEMAGRLADGVIIMMGNVAAKMAHVARGAAAVARPAPPVFVYTTAAIVEDVEKVSKAFKAGCIRIAQLEGPAVFEEAGVRVELPAGGHTMGAPGDLGHAASAADVAHLVDHLVSDEAALWFARNRVLLGSEADVAAHLARLRDLGVAGVTMTQISGSALPDRLIETLGPLIRSFA